MTQAHNSSLGDRVLHVSMDVVGECVIVRLGQRHLLLRLQPRFLQLLLQQTPRSRVGVGQVVVQGK